MKVAGIQWEKFKLFLYVEKGLTSNTANHYSNRSRFLKIYNHFKFVKWDKDNFRKLLYSMEERGNKDSTINKIITMGRYVDEYLDTSITQGFKYRKEKVSKIDNLLTPSEIRSMALTYIPYRCFRSYINSRQKALIMLLGTTGCRISEALNLTWDEIYTSPYPHIVFVDTKNGDDREVPLGIDVKTLIDSLPHRSKYVFDSGRGVQFSLQDNNIDLKRRARVVGIKKRVYNHLLRHSYISTMLEVGVSESDVMKIVGHRDYKSLLRYKNSSISYYKKVIARHPLNIHEVSFKEKVSIVQDLINATFLNENCSIKTFKDNAVFKVSTNINTS